MEINVYRIRVYFRELRARGRNWYFLFIRTLNTRDHKVYDPFANGNPARGKSARVSN